MLKAGLIGIGFMGRGHLDHYMRLESEGVPIRLTSICDIDEKKFKGIFIDGNLDVGNQIYDFSKYTLYTDIDEMLVKEQLDFIDICLPTYMHAEVTLKAFRKGIHVLCEKPMALNTQDCQQMIDAAKQNGKKLMIGQCLRFWPEYEYLKETVESGKYGEVLGGTFFRGGQTPVWSYGNWMLDKNLSGGCILDQHIHDVDLVHWLFGNPESVSTIGKVVIPGSGFDIVSTNYIYPDGRVIHTRGDWTLNGDQGFRMYYHVNFEKANIEFDEGVIRVYPNGSSSFIPKFPKEGGHYREIKYFIEALLNNIPIRTAAPESTMTTIRIAEAEVKSANLMGALVKVDHPVLKND